MYYLFVFDLFINWVQYYPDAVLFTPLTTDGWRPLGSQGSFMSGPSYQPVISSFGRPRNYRRIDPVCRDPNPVLFLPETCEREVNSSFRSQFVRRMQGWSVEQINYLGHQDSAHVMRHVHAQVWSGSGVSRLSPTPQA